MKDYALNLYKTLKTFKLMLGVFGFSVVTLWLFSTYATAVWSSEGVSIGGALFAYSGVTIISLYNIYCFRTMIDVLFYLQKTIDNPPE